MFEACSRNDGEDCTRRTYCIAEAADGYNGPAVVTSDLIDSLLYDVSYIEGIALHDEFEARFGSDGRSIVKVFSYLQASGAELPLARRVSIARSEDSGISRTSYAVETEWSLSGENYVSEPFRTRYNFDVYPGGDVQAQVERPDMLRPGQWDQAPMTPYDYEQLFNELRELDEMIGIQRHDSEQLEWFRLGEAGA